MWPFLGQKLQFYYQLELIWSETKRSIIASVLPISRVLLSCRIYSVDAQTETRTSKRKPSWRPVSLLRSRSIHDLSNLCPHARDHVNETPRPEPYSRHRAITNYRTFLRNVRPFLRMFCVEESSTVLFVISFCSAAIAFLRRFFLASLPNRAHWFITFHMNRYFMSINQWTEEQTKHLSLCLLPEQRTNDRSIHSGRAIIFSRRCNRPKEMLFPIVREYVAIFLWEQRQRWQSMILIESQSGYVNAPQMGFSPSKEIEWQTLIDCADRTRIIADRRRHCNRIYLFAQSERWY